MASNHLIILALVAIVLPTVAMATDHIVGDDNGWKVKFDYQAWAKGREFHVGDKLVFQYKRDAHNVFKVNGTGFNECIIPPINEALATGNDTIKLSTPGNKWYICGVNNHCADLGMKLAITVRAEAPAPSPGNSAAFQASQVFVAAMVFIAMIIV